MGREEGREEGGVGRERKEVGRGVWRERGRRKEQ